MPRAWESNVAGPLERRGIHHNVVVCATQGGNKRGEALGGKRIRRVRNVGLAIQEVQVGRGSGNNAVLQGSIAGKNGVNVTFRVNVQQVGGWYLK